MPDLPDGMPDNRSAWSRRLPEQPGDEYISVVAQYPLQGVAHAIDGPDETSCGALSPYWEHRMVDLDVARRLHRPCKRCDWTDYNRSRTAT